MENIYYDFKYSNSIGKIASSSTNICLLNDEIITSSCDTVFVWDIRSEKLLYTLAQNRNDLSYNSISHISHLNVNPDNTLLYASMDNGDVIVWDRDEKSIINIMHGHSSKVVGTLLSLDGQLLCSYSFDTDVVIWDTQSNEGKYRLVGHQQPVTKTVFIYSILKNMQEDENTTPYALFSTTPKYLLSTSLDGYMKLWDLTTQLCVQTISSHSNAAIQYMYMLPDQKYLLADTGGNFFEIYEINKDYLLSYFGNIGKPEQLKNKKTKHIECLYNFTNIDIENPLFGITTSQGIFINHIDQCFRVYDTPSTLVVSSNCNKIMLIQCLSIKSQNKRRLKSLKNIAEKLKKKVKKISTIDELDTELFDVIDDSFKITFDEKVEHDTEEIKSKFDLLSNIYHELANKVQASNNPFESIDDDEIESKLATYDIRYNKVHTKFIVAPSLIILNEDINNFDIIKNETMYIFGFSNKKNYLYLNYIDIAEFHNKAKENNIDNDFFSKRLIQYGENLSIPSNVIKILPFNESDSFLLLGLAYIFNFNASTLKTNYRIDHKNHFCSANCTYTCGNILKTDSIAIFGTSKGSLEFFDLKNCIKLYKMKNAHDDCVIELLLTNEQDTIYTFGSKDKTIICWKLHNPDEINNVLDQSQTTSKNSILKEQNRKIVNETITAACISHDGKYLAIGLLNSQIIILYADSLNVHCMLFGHSLPITSIIFEPNSKRLLSSSLDRTIKIWDIQFGNIIKSLKVTKTAHANVLKILNNDLLLIGTSDGFVKYYDYIKYNMIAERLVLKNSIKNIAISHTNDTIIVSDDNANVIILNKSDNIIYVLDEQKKREAYDEYIAETRPDKNLYTSGAAQINIFTRPTKKNLEVVTTVDALIDEIDIANSNLPTASHNILGISADQWKYNKIVTINSNSLPEILLALPYKYVKDILCIMFTQLNNYYNKIEKNAAISLLYLKDIEIINKIILIIVHSQFNTLATNDEIKVMLKENRNLLQKTINLIKYELLKTKSLNFLVPNI